MQPIRILLVDDRRLMRYGLRVMLEKYDDIQIVGEASDIEYTLSVVAMENPHVVIVDGMSASIDLSELVIQINKTYPENTLAILVLTNEPDERALCALRQGARGILLKQAAPEHLMAAIRMIAAGYSLFITPMAPPMNGPMIGTQK